MLIAENDIYLLLDQLIEDYEKTKTSLGVFGQYTIVVPNKSLENWLSAQIVKRIGISSGIRFESLHKVLHRIYKRGTETPAELVDKTQLAGLIFHTLSDLDLKNINAGDALFIVKQWLNMQSTQQSLAKLCHALADVFELYQIYRVDWLDAWSKHEAILGEESEQWQSEIWRIITSMLPEGTFLHRQHLTAAFEYSAKQSDFADSLKGTHQLSIFGVTQLDTVTLKQLSLVNSHIPVNFYWLMPSQQIFGCEVEVATNKELTMNQQAYFHGNDLLASWGSLSRQQVIAFESHKIECSASKLDISEPETLLSTIKNKLLINENITHLDAELDESITVCAHFSRYREVEGLHDYLLEQINTNENLSVTDIVVMCPDINNYASYIHAIFENQKSKHKIPFQVCGVSALASDVASVALELVNLPETRYPLSDVIDLLNHSYLRNRFELSSEDVEQIHSWFKQANVYWGLDKTSLRQLELPEYDRYTLQCGIDRMVLGLSLDGKSIMLDEHLLYGVEGMSALHSSILSKLIAFVDALKNWRDVCLEASGDQRKYTISTWCEKLRSLTDTFISAPHKEAESLNVWFRLITDVEQSFLDSGSETEYSYAFINALLAQKVEETSISSSAYRYGRVNFGSFGALKGVPAKVVALLGMNESDFPRKSKADSIDLTKTFSRLGDRNPVEQDKDAFMMSLMNCQAHFYCSYIGHDIRSNNPRIPSLLLQELLDFIQAEPEKQKALINFHPMKAYSEAYFQADNALFTYQNFLNTNLLPDNGHEQTLDVNTLPEWEMPPQLTIQELKNFLEDPAKAFFKARFNVDLPSLSDESNDDEPMAATGLTRWKYIDELLKSGIQQHGISNELTEMVGEPYKASGLMEHDYLAESTLSDWNETAKSILDNVLIAKGQKKAELMPVDLSLTVEGDSIKLVGDIDLFSDKNESQIIQLVHKDASKVSEKYLMRAIVDTRIAESLKLDNQSNFKRTYLACKDKLFHLNADEKSGKQSLETWVGLYKSIMNAPIALDISSAGKMTSEQSYREAFTQVVEDSKSTFSGLNLSEALKVLSHDKEAVDRGEDYMEHYQYLKPGKKPEEDQMSPHWIESKEGDAL